ncbi:uncharacterized protein Dwil_GK26916 [Drosophila willistoni]|uniref:Uncharacterized protein n=1 Tax=Drosophila willistoni TaxID=7260 RepID=A0A0Q9WT12_DROWI|nr:uncharacterized protein Dwil_GK26916 [Drosophila willistoni]
MPDLVNCFLRVVYVYTWLLGLRNFDMDLNTGKTWTTRSGTFFAAVINILWFSLLPIQIFLYDASIKRAQVLYDYVFMLMSMIRIVGVFIILLMGWLRRCQIRNWTSELMQL